MIADEMEATTTTAYLKFQSRWDKTIFFGSIIGSIIILFLTFARYDKCSTIAKENQLLKKENVQLQKHLKELKIKNE